MVKNIIIAFHTMARKYCINRIENFTQENLIWGDKFHEVIKNSDFNSPELNELYNKYPRYDVKIHILKMVLNEIETINFDNLSSIYQIKEALMVAAHKATIHYGNGFAKATENDIFRGCYEEKQLFSEYINSIKDENLKTFEALPYRRVLSYEEIVRIKEIFETSCCKDIWSYSHINTEEIVSFNSNYFLEIVEKEKLIEILKKSNSNKIYLIDTCNLPPVSYLMDIALLNISVVTGDVIWCSEMMDWGIVKDHEGHISICSKWLIQEIESEYPILGSKQQK